MWKSHGKSPKGGFPSESHLQAAPKRTLGALVYLPAYPSNDDHYERRTMELLKYNLPFIPKIDYSYLYHSNHRIHLIVNQLRDRFGAPTMSHPPYLSLSKLAMMIHGSCIMIYLCIYDSLWFTQSEI